MIRGMYNAATALDAAMQRQEVIADNLAHLATPGHRARGINFEAFEAELAHNSASNRASLIHAGVRSSGQYTNFQPGAIRHTGATYDLALEGDGFFALEGPNGTVYTRNGAFHVNADGQLLSTSYYPVLGTGGPINIPAESRTINIARDGSVSADGASVGQLQLSRFADASRLVQVGPTIYEAPVDAGVEDGQANVMQGFLETSNATPAGSMVEMIQASRYFEAAQRALRSIAETLQLNTRPNN